MGNYRSFGDNKIIPGLSKESLWAVIKSSTAYHNDPVSVKTIWQGCAEAIYSLGSSERELAFPPNGKTSYYSPNCSQEDAEFVQEFMTDKNISPYNTRLFKRPSQDGKVAYELRLASVATTSN
jgi:dipeptidyl-peptidase-3